MLSGLVSYWKLDEASGQRADSVGANHLTDNNTVGAGLGKVTVQAASFVSANEETLSRADNADLSMGTDTSFEFSLWLYVAAFGTYGVVCKSGEYLLLQNSNELLWLVYYNGGAAAAQITVSPAFAATGWHLINAWHDKVADQIGVQINNATPVTAAHSGGTWNGTSDLQLGAQTTIRYLEGRLNGVGFWKDRALTVEEHTRLWNGGAGVVWPFTPA